MGKGETWSQAEESVLDDYFQAKINELTAYHKILTVNPTRSYEAMTRKIRHLRTAGAMKPKEQAIKRLRVGYLDIEASDLNADIGMMLTAAIKPAGKREVWTTCIKKSEIFDYTHDKRIVEELLKALNDYDVIYTHYGSDARFDIPFIRTRAYRHGMEELLPAYMEKFLLDTYPIARQKLKLHSNRLDSIGSALGIKIKKTPLDPRHWEMARSGHPESLAYIMEHNIRDVQLLEAVHNKLRIVERPKYVSM